MKPAELKELSVKDLQEKLEELKASLAKMKFTHSVSGVENPIQIREKRRDVARTMTEINARKETKEKAEK